MTFRKRATGAGLEVALEAHGCLFVSELEPMRCKASTFCIVTVAAMAARVIGAEKEARRPLGDLP
jgi:hypothetical protein